MFLLTYRDAEEEFEALDVRDIKARFRIPERKNLYKVDARGELEKIDNRNILERLRTEDKLEALSDFTLGRRPCG
jgi:hypothetical protein